MTAVAEFFFVQDFGGQRAGTRPAPTEPLGGVCNRRGGGARGQAQGLPLLDRLAGFATAVGVAARGQAQGLPPTGSLGGIATAVGVAHEGRHKACPYGITWGGLQPQWGVAREGRPQGLPLRMVARGVEHRSLTEPFQLSHDGGAYEGGRCGGNPPAQGRAEGPTAQMRGESEEEREVSDTVCSDGECNVELMVA